MASYVSSIDVGDQLKSRLVVKVTFSKVFKIRLWLAVQMLKAVALVCPLSVLVGE